MQSSKKEASPSIPKKDSLFSTSDWLHVTT